MPARRLDDRIRHLCDQLPATSGDDVEDLLQELLTAIHEKIERLRRLAAKQLLHGESQRDRRKVRA